ncbi:Hypothetical predicted protein [Lecanosticta acicola]|uniref:Uncharacterized protein n=1 Tax=Lecanosticta acicola TaxID=111012 RepID=A0AAI9EBB8_9PEZI|nr:Hypothetical predicted protein [Lecanosticta acicola]
MSGRQDYTFSGISERSSLEPLLAEYPELVPSKLKDLDQFRYETIQNILNDRRTKGSAYLLKEDVVKLVEWKLSHGTFRPSLKKLVESNSEEDVRAATANAFKTDVKDKEGVKAALDVLTKLKGIGPATASLLLSVCHASRVPFFSDELYRFCFWEEGKGTGWDRPIKYKLKEYLALFEKVNEKRTLNAVDLEKAAYVLGKTAAKPSSGESSLGKRKASDNSNGQKGDEKKVKGDDAAGKKTGPKTNQSKAGYATRSSAKPRSNLK